MLSAIGVGCGAHAVREPVAPEPVAQAVLDETGLAGVVGAREYVIEAPLFGGPLYVLEAGSASAPPLVLIHGLGERAARDFAPILPAIAAHHRVLAFDLPGFGRSTREHGDYSPERYAQLVEAMIARTFQGPVAVLGHSMGGAIALLHASLYPASVARLALLDVAGILHYRAYARDMMGTQAGGRDPLYAPLRGWSGKLFDVFSWPVGGVRLESMKLDSELTVMPNLSSGTTAALLFVRYDFGHALRTVRAPVWLGWGARDEVAPQRTADALRYLLRPSVDVTFEGSGHVPMATEPEALVASLNSFLAAPAPSASARSPFVGSRVGSCRGEAMRVFEGDYRELDIERCTQVVLRHVRARALRVVDSSVQLTDVELQADDVGLVAERATLQWTGGGIWASVCADLSAAALDVMGVSCVASGEPFLVRSASRLTASVSESWRGAVRNPLHGDIALRAASAR